MNADYLKSHAIFTAHPEAHKNMIILRKSKFQLSIPRVAITTTKPAIWFHERTLASCCFWPWDADVTPQVIHLTTQHPPPARPELITQLLRSYENRSYRDEHNEFRIQTTCIYFLIHHSAFRCGRPLSDHRYRTPLMWANVLDAMKAHSHSYRISRNAYVCYVPTISIWFN